MSHKVNVPLGVDNDAQNVSDLFGALLFGHVVLPQDHAVHIPRPVGQFQIPFPSYFPSYSAYYLYCTASHSGYLVVLFFHQMQCPAVSTQRGPIRVPPQV